MEDNTTVSNEVSESAEAAVEPAQQAGEISQEHAVSEEKPRNVKKLKLKVDGSEYEEEIDLDNEEYLVRQLQLAKAAQKRMQEASMTKKQAEQFIKMLRQDPIKVLQNPHLGVDFRKIAEDYLAAQLEQELLSPEERQLREYKQKVEEFESEKKRQQEEAEQTQMARLQEHYAQEYDKKITEALSQSGLPKTPKTVRRMAELMSKNLEFGYELEPKQLVEMVREDYLNEIRELIGASEGDTLLKILGDDVSNKIRKADLARLKTPAPQQSAKVPTESSRQKRDRTMSTEEWLEEVRRRATE